MARILVYGLNYAPEPTGTGKYTGEMAAWLVCRGHQVDAIAALPHYPSWKVDESYAGRGFHTESLNGVRVFRSPLFVPPPNKLTAANRIRLETSYTLNVFRYWAPILAKPKRYDAIIAVTPPMQIAVYPLLSRLFGRVPWVLHVQDLQVDAALRLGMIRTSSLGRILYGIENNLLRRATRVSTITEAMRKRVLAKGVAEERTWLFPNWSDIEFIRPIARNSSFRRSLGIMDHETMILYAGNMGEKQGLELVLQAAAQMCDDKGVRFVMVGAGAALDRLVRLSQALSLTNLMFVPVQPVERLPEMLAAADIHLVVQRREAADLVMPSKLTNILSSGRPAVATADPGTALHEVVLGHGTGLVCPPDDVQAFVVAVRRLRGDALMREEMGRNARAYAEQYLDKEFILCDFERKLLELIAGNGRDKR